MKDTPNLTLEVSTSREELLKETRQEESKIQIEEPWIHLASFEEGKDTPNKKAHSPLGRRDAVLLILTYLFSIGFPILGMIIAGVGLEQQKKTKRRGLQAAYGAGLAMSMLCFVLWIIYLTW